MNILSLNKKESFILFAGDVILLYVALWITLAVRYGALPTKELLNNHLMPFSLLFLVWVLIFFIAGLYEKHTLILKSRLPSILLNTQIINSVVAVLFFYFIPYFGITPKTNLFLYLLISFALILGWRILGVPVLGFRKKQKAILIGSGEEMRELRDEVNGNPRYNLTFVSSIDLDQLEGVDFEDEILNTIYGENISTIVIDLKNEKVEPILPRLYNLIFSKIKFIDKYKVYEDIFDRVPLSLVGYNWFLENVSSSSHIAYDFLKRLMDMVIALLLGIASLILYPFVYIAIKLDDGGPFFFIAERVGRNNKEIKLIKFRSMATGSQGGGIEEEPQITRIGNFLRKTRIDELPQLWNVLKGDISLVGPRPETPELVKLYEKEIPYYNVRHLIKPGLSGWAQMYHEEHPHHGPDIEETRRKLSYDLYYIKNRSVLLDLKIALKTLKTLLSRGGR
ncbi:MAG: sugar transferase [Patescibacteria group bacterium]|nr:sugar transferase [Patescibacteria group bacterium]